MVATDSIIVSGTDRGLAASVVRSAVRSVLDAEHRDARISVTFLGKRRMRDLNRRYLNHDWPTDVVSFSLPQPGDGVAGDVYVCRYQAARSARAHATTVREEVIRLIVHGTLHVLGWEHPDDGSRVQSPMWQRQEQYVAGLT